MGALSDSNFLYTLTSNFAQGHHIAILSASSCKTLWEQTTCAFHLLGQIFADHPPPPILQNQWLQDILIHWFIYWGGKCRKNKDIFHRCLTIAFKPRFGKALCANPNTEASGLPISILLFRNTTTIMNGMVDDFRSSNLQINSSLGLCSVTKLHFLSHERKPLLS